MNTRLWLRIGMVAVLGGAGCGSDESRIYPPVSSSSDAGGAGGIGGTGDTAGAGGTGGAPLCHDGDTQPCYSGDPGTENVGLCEAGTQTCNNGMFGPCVGEVLPSEETCNHTDEDCDGTVDEGCICVDGDTQQCYSGPPSTAGQGECKEGVQTCTDETWGACTGEVTPVSEVCDNLDNDCDGSTDEGNPGGGGLCNTGKPGVCSAGTQQCQNGQLNCVQTNSPSAEICDAKDNDCDGQTDEGNPGGGGGPCNTGQPGVCSAGTLQCQNGQLKCVQTNSPSAEICDNLDNNCDGKIDGHTQPCGYCNKGTQTCSGGDWGTCMNTGCAPGTKKTCTPKYQYGCTASQTCSSSTCTWGNCVSTCSPFTPTVGMPGVYSKAFQSYGTGPNCFGSTSSYGPWQVCPHESHIYSISCKMDSSSGSCSVIQQSSLFAGIKVNSVNDCFKDAKAHMVVKCIAN